MDGTIAAKATNQCMAYECNAAAPARHTSLLLHTCYVRSIIFFKARDRFDKSHGATYPGHYPYATWPGLPKPTNVGQKKPAFGHLARCRGPRQKSTRVTPKPARPNSLYDGRRARQPCVALAPLTKTLRNNSGLPESRDIIKVCMYVRRYICVHTYIRSIYYISRYNVRSTSAWT